LPTFYNDEVTASEYRYRKEHSFFGINAEQYIYFTLRPLFRALYIVISEPVENAIKQIVHLVSTGIVPSGLSEDEGTRGEISDRDVVTTSLPTAIELVMELEKREQWLYPDRRDPTILDECLKGKVATNNYARYLGYTGGEIQGPSTNWISRRDSSSTEDSNHAKC
jgi:hypothetical protein